MENKVITKEYVRNIILEKIDWLDEQMQRPEKALIYANYRYTKNILEELLEKIK